MYTQCPRCRTIFAVDENALQASLGIVLCGHCAERFDALLTLTDRLPSDPAASLPERSADALAPTLTDSIAADGRAKGMASDAPVGDSEAAHGVEPGGARQHDAWLASLSGARTQALIADAAGVPEEALQEDSAWRVVELPLQSGDIELDTIPLVPAAEIAPANDMPDAEPVEFVEAVHSEPFTGPWTVDIPAAGAAEAAAASPATAIEATGADATATAPAAAPAASHMPSPATLLAAEEPPDDTTTRGDAPPLEPDDVPMLTDTDIIADVAPDIAGDEPEPVLPEPAAPVYVRPRQPRIRRSEWLWAAGCLVLALGLAAQVAWANRVSLVLDPATQALALRACTRIACRLPPIRDTAKLELLSRDIRPDSKAAHALAITATFRNNAPFRQPWPVVVVRLTDLDNNPVAMRRFRPAEYLPDPHGRAAGIAPGTTAAVAFEVADPGPRAVSFNFGFE